MTLMEDYLRAVALFLPRQQRDDIIVELRDTILTRIEADQAERGRPLTDDEVEAILREIGHPLVVAARYREGPQHVVGPALYPYWLFAVKAAVTIQVVVAAAVFLVRSFSGGDVGQALGEAIGSSAMGAVTLVGLATVAAWLIERQGVRIDYLNRWRVRDLGVLRFAAWDLDTYLGRAGGGRSPGVERPAPGHGRPAPSPPAAQALGPVVAVTVFVLWWLGLLHFGVYGDMADLREAGIEPGPLASLDWAGLKAMLFWPVLAYGAVSIIHGLVVLAWPWNLSARGLLNMVLGAGSIAFCAWFWLDSPLAAAVRVDSLAELVARLRAGLGHGAPLALAPMLTVALIGFAFGGACQVLHGLWEILASLGRRREAAA